MTPRRFLIVALGTALAVAFLVVCLVPHDVAFEGKGVREWALLMRSGNPAEKEAAVIAFLKMGERAVPELAEIVSKPESPVRRWLWTNGSRFRRPFSSRVLTLAGPLTRDLRLGAANALTLLGARARGAIPGLLQAVNTDERQIAFEAAQALAAIGPEAVPALRSALEYGRGCAPEVAAGAAGRMGSDGVSLAPSLAGLVRSTNWNAGSAALAALSNLGLAAVPDLAELATGSSGSGYDGARNALMQVYQRATWNQGSGSSAAEQYAKRRADALTILASSPKSAKDLPLVCSLLNDPADEVRLVALRTLDREKMDLKPALAGLLRCLEGGSPEAREVAAVLLGSMGANANPVIPRLRRLAENPNDPSAPLALIALKKIEAGRVLR